MRSGTQTGTTQQHPELRHTFADVAPVGLREYRISGTVNASSTFYSQMTPASLRQPCSTMLKNDRVLRKQHQAVVKWKRCFEREASFSLCGGKWLQIAMLTRAGRFGKSVKRKGRADHSGEESSDTSAKGRRMITRFC